MICIMLFHQTFFDGRFATIMHTCGHWGVDFFVLVSGYGITRSLERNSLSRYYKNRISRLLPTCLFMGILSLAVLCYIGEIPRKRFLLLAIFKGR